jgi:hypothetical protein
MKGMFRFRPAIQHVERYHSVVTCALNMEHLISKYFCKIIELLDISTVQFVLKNV